MKSWKQLLFEEESKKWQYNGGDDMAVDHNDEGINAMWGYWLYQNLVISILFSLISKQC